MLPGLTRRKPGEPVDALCLKQACKGLLTELRCSVLVWAEHYDVPSDILAAMLADSFIFERAGIPPLPAEEFARMANEETGSVNEPDSN